MRNISVPRLIAIGLAVGVAAGGLGFAVSVRAGAAPSSDAPKYYVDGARPSADAMAGNLAGCVPWSEQRTDVHICGPIPSGWQPVAPPHFDAQICQDAETALTQKAGEVERAYGLTPVIDPSSCLVTERSLLGGYDWFVSFNLTNASDTYDKAIVILDTDGGLLPRAFLS